MLAATIMDLIRRRQDEFRGRYASAQPTGSGEIRFTTTEYESLIGEIQRLCEAHTPVHAGPVVEDDHSEDWILGDQGQCGG